MCEYRRYNYWIVKNDPDSPVRSTAGIERRLKKGNILVLGEWFAHEQTPYRKGNYIYRDRYGKQIELAKWDEKSHEWRI